MQYTGVKLGQAVNLLRGFRPMGNPADCTASPFHAVENVPFRLYDVGFAGTGAWEPVCVSLHDTAQSLAGEIFEYRVLPFANEERGFSVDTGALLAGFENQLGVAIAPGHSYMLIQARRHSGRAVHEVFARPEPKPFDRRVHLTRDGVMKIANLRPGHGSGTACIAMHASRRRKRRNISITFRIPARILFRLSKQAMPSTRYSPLRPRRTAFEGRVRTALGKRHRLRP